MFRRSVKRTVTKHKPHPCVVVANWEKKWMDPSVATELHELFKHNGCRVVDVFFYGHKKVAYITLATAKDAKMVCEQLDRSWCFNRQVSVLPMDCAAATPLTALTQAAVSAKMVKTSSAFKSTASLSKASLWSLDTVEDDLTDTYVTANAIRVESIAFGVQKEDMVQWLSQGCGVPAKNVIRVEFEDVSNKGGNAGFVFLESVRACDLAIARLSKRQVFRGNIMVLEKPRSVPLIHQAPFRQMKRGLLEAVDDYPDDSLDFAALTSASKKKRGSSKKASKAGSKISMHEHMRSFLKKPLTESRPVFAIPKSPPLVPESHSFERPLPAPVTVDSGVEPIEEMPQMAELTPTRSLSLEMFRCTPPIPLSMEFPLPPSESSTTTVPLPGSTPPVAVSSAMPPPPPSTCSRPPSWFAPRPADFETVLQQLVATVTKGCALIDDVDFERHLFAFAEFRLCHAVFGLLRDMQLQESSLASVFTEGVLESANGGVAQNVLCQILVMFARCHGSWEDAGAYCAERSDEARRALEECVSIERMEKEMVAATLARCVDATNIAKLRLKLIAVERNVNAKWSYLLCLQHVDAVATRNAWAYLTAEIQALCSKHSALKNEEELIAEFYCL